MYKYQKYEIQDVDQSMEAICFPTNKQFSLLPQQAFLSEYLYDNPNVSGLLVYHEIGSGKTCTAISIGEKFKSQMKIIVILPAALIGNFMGELRGLCPENTSGVGIYMSVSQRAQLAKLNPSDKAYKEIIELVDKKIGQYYSIYSYHKFHQDFYKGLINFNNSLVIIDEVQNMVSLTGDLIY